MNELLHRASAILEAVWARLLDVVRVRLVVAVDETRLRIIRDKAGKAENGFVWTFGARDDDGGLDVACAEDRSGSTPRALLEGTKGALLVDGYSGHNVVYEVSTRRRAGMPRAPASLLPRGAAEAPVAQEMLDVAGCG